MFEQPPTDLVKDLLNRLEKRGEAHYRLLALARHEIFDDLSKHNHKWDHDDPEIFEKLDATRRALSVINEELYDILSLLKDQDSA